MAKYMHTIKNQPASFEDGQIVYSRKNIKLVDSLFLIRRQQKLSREWRTKKGFTINDDYGYVTIKDSNA